MVEGQYLAYKPLELMTLAVSSAETEPSIEDSDDGLVCHHCTEFLVHHTPFEEKALVVSLAEGSDGGLACHHSTVDLPLRMLPGFLYNNDRSVSATVHERWAN